MDDKLASEILDKTKKAYNLIARDFSRTRHNLWPELFAIFNDYTRDGDKILDIGCGNGRLLDLIGKKEINYIGIDNSEGQIKEAQKKYPNRNFMVANALNLPFPDNSFDNVFLIAVLHHIPSKELRQKAIEEIKRVLRPGGHLLLTAWRPMSAEMFFLALKYSFLKLIGGSKLDFGDALVPWGKKAERYYHLFTKEELEKLVGGSGFKVLKSGVVSNAPQGGKRQNLYLVAEKGRP